MPVLGSPAADDTVDLVDDEVGFKLGKFCGKYRLRLLVGLLIFLVIAGIVFAVAWILTRPPKICKTALCYEISKDISNQLDKSVDPCNDFYSYTCGGFFKSHKLGANESHVGSSTIIYNDNLKVLRSALQNSSFNYSQSLSIKKTIKIYNSCLNTTAINNRGKDPLVKLIEKYGGWTVTNTNRSNVLLEELMGRVLRELNVQTLLKVVVVTDLYDSNKHILNIIPSQLGMSAGYYKDKSENVKIQKAYKTYMRRIGILLGGDPSTVKDRMDEIYDLEKKLAKAYEAGTVSDDLVETVQQYHRSGRTVDSLDKTLDDFSFASGFTARFMQNFLNAAFSLQGKKFSSNEEVFYQHKKGGEAPIFKSIYDTFISYNSRSYIVKNYIMWKVVSNYVQSMPDRFVKAKLQLNEAVTGRREYQRWSACIQGLMLPMDMTIGRMFVDAHFDENTKSTVKDMTTRVRKSFINNLKSQDWMDKNTKDKAREKANAMKEDVGYPSFIKDDSKLDALYAMLNVSDDFFDNTLALNKMVVQKNLGMLDQQVDRDRWPDGPAQVNAYYNRRQNRIVFLAGILQSPFYKKNYPRYFNYGSLGLVVGHELTHGFDAGGRLFDKDGNLKDWWSPSSTLNFNSRASCLIYQYNSYEVFGHNINGKQTLNENIADNGGIKLAYDAYKSWVSDHEKEGQLPDLNLSVDQLFFIGFATPWCSVYKKDAALFQLRTDSHSYNKYRVIGSLSNFERFSKAFSCSSSKEMNRGEDRCAVW
ncbi:EEF1AKMT4-ECE2 readthrough transcript protein-like [Porites lutea]|uniref:EEF1AKMT4-ECE2 readthrough transcript protein-like n=1 Tax=Porites lutea TaxID=51062 RepID=UPI003CC5C88E